ncbi:MAG TPA: molybdenum ABC transporter ATP-binding protein [Geminicoccaceae bacterium]|nr:molybdenum ABC transporter ATP-binding protein [Geminicoccus sp.]HMU48818.1 molybdenum ABC transporter ATP-binding protein [Geminicoccaceae bacterium]
MSLEVDIAMQLGTFELEARFTATSGITALFGRSGSGKTSIINAIAGLIRPERGRIAVDGTVLLDRERGIDLPAHRRRVGYVFQEARLFPHLTVRQNLLYGRWFTPPRERSATLDEIVELLALGSLLGRRPSRLSGGERQRVAIGRALLASPRILLMDEPLASLDAARKAEILPFVERLGHELRLPVVYVSHALEEVARLASTVVLVAEGRVADAGPTADVLTRMDSAGRSGRFETASLLEVRVAGQDESFGLTRLDHSAGTLVVPALAVPAGTTLRLRIRARDVAVSIAPPHGLSIRNVLRGRVARLVPMPPALVEVELDLAGSPLAARITRRSAVELDLSIGREVWALIKSAALEGPGATPALSWEDESELPG